MNRPVVMFFLAVVLVIFVAVIGTISLDTTETGIVSRLLPSSRSSEMNDRAVKLLGEGKSLEAVKIFRDIRQMEPYDSVIAHNLSLGLARMAQDERGGSSEGEKVALLQESLDAWPENPEALNVLSAIHYRNGRYREAWNLAVRLAAFYPNQPNLNEYIAHLETYLNEGEGMVSEEGQYFRILYSGERQLEFEVELLSLLQTEMDSLTAAMGYFPAGAIDVLIMTEDMGEKAIPADPFLRGLYDGKIRLYLKDGSPEDEAFIKTVRHEMVHALLHRAGGNLPAWFQEGVAQAVGETPASGETESMRAFLAWRMDAGKQVTVSGLQGSFVDLPEDERAAAYAASYTFVDYLVGIYGENLIPVLVAELEGGVPLEQILESMTGKDLASLESEFLNNLKRGG